MEEQKKNFPQQGWEEWDAASVLYFRKAGLTAVSEEPKEQPAIEPETQVEAQPEPKPVPKPVPVEEPRPMQTKARSSLPDAPVRRPRKKRKPRPNYKGWAILIGAAVLAILLLSLLIYGVVALVSPSDEPEATTTTTTETEPTTTVDYEAIAADLLKTAERQAAMYDYDGAIATLRSFGTGWAQREDFAEAKTRFEAAKAETVRWADTTTIPHVFFHSLIADTNRCFDGDEDEDGYNLYMTTIYEFNAMLEQMYERGYVLVGIHDIAKLTTDENGNQVYRQGDIYLPEGKIPVVMSQDDVNYYEYMSDGNGDREPDAGGDGFASKLLLKDGTVVCEYVTAEGELVYGDYDLVPILERFVEEHPDFSYRGAKAIIALTGFEGVYGYRTHPEWEELLGKDAYQKEVREAKELTAWLKENGWEIASHSYGHPGYGNISAERVISDVQKWEDEVQPIVGDTDIFIYPYGNDIAGIEKYSGEKYRAMYDAGYRYFCNVDSADYWVQIWDDYVRQGRRNLDGYRMWHDPEMLDDLFDVETVFDPARPTPVPSL